MKFYTVVGSPNSRKVQAVINHLGLTVESEYLDFFAGDLRTPAQLAVNPNGMVPVLVDGPLKLWESNAIMQYLADTAGNEALFPRDPARRYDVARWQFWEGAHFNKAFGVIAFEAVAKPGFGLGPTNVALVDTMKENLQRFAAVLNGHLAGRTHMVGTGVTLADYAVIHLEGFKEAIPFDWAPYPNVNAYFDRMRAVEPWARTAPPSREAIGRRPGHR
jgi:glutathione S-transferase